MDVIGLCNGLNGFKQPNLKYDKINVLLLKLVFSHHAYIFKGVEFHVLYVLFSRVIFQPLKIKVVSSI